MIKKVVATLLIASSLACASEVSVKHNLNSFQSKDWDIGAFASMIAEGDDGDYLQDSFGVGLHIAYRYSDDWSAVLEVSSANSDVDIIGNVNIVDIVVGTTYDMYSEDDFFTPYFGLALGYRTISDIDDVNVFNIIPSVGLKFLVSDSIQIFLEGKLRFNFKESEKGGMGSLGASYLF